MRRNEGYEQESYSPCLPSQTLSVRMRCGLLAEAGEGHLRLPPNRRNAEKGGSEHGQQWQREGQDLEGGGWPWSTLERAQANLLSP